MCGDGESMPRPSQREGFRRKQRRQSVEFLDGDGPRQDGVTGSDAEFRVCAVACHREGEGFEGHRVSFLTDAR